MNLLKLMVTTGYSNVMDDDSNRTVRTVNLVCIITALMSTIFGLCFFFLTGELRIYLPALLQASIILGVILLNKASLYTIANFTLLIAYNVSVQYYNAILGNLAEVHLLFIFLVALSLLIFDKPVLRYLGIGITFLSFLTGEINVYYLFVPPLLMASGDQMNTFFIIRWLTIPSILFLDTLVIYQYVKKIDVLRKRELELVNSKLEAAKKHNEELFCMTIELEKATKAKSVFVRETSHEIRTPLNAIFGISQLLQMKVEQHPSLAPIRQLADHLHAASYNTKEIINNILEFSKIEAGKLDRPETSTLNVRQWMSDTINMHQYVAAIRNVKIKHSIANEMPDFITADKMVLTKIINNLLSNAIKFTAKESVVTLRIFASGNKWYMQVSDQGAGIPEEKQATIFDAFVSERNIFLEGTGLGLHITHRLVESLNGDIEVSSVIGKGTSFTVSMPLVITKRSGNGDNERRTQHYSNLNDTVILIIEDDKMSQLVLSRFLTGLGSRVMLAENGVEGLLLARAARPDIIILDSHTPGMSGTEILQCIRQDTILKNIPVIIASGDPFKEASEELLQAGANEYMIKPIEFKMLHATLSKYLEGITHS